MFGEPSDVEGQCNARLFIGDNYGDEHMILREDDVLAVID